MKTHLEHLQEHVPQVMTLKVLDLGSGKGAFLVELAKKGGTGVGLEVSTGYIQETKRRAAEARVQIDVTQGVGESLPYPDNSFDFVNMSEVIEHVNDPRKVMSEVHRVLKKGGKAYVSVPRRFSLKDPHFHLYFVNWMPRTWSESFISLFGKHKNYNVDTGKQRLTELHYFTDKQSRALLVSIGFTVEDIRKIKILRKFNNSFVQALGFIVYGLTAPWHFSTYHYLITKK
jgi:ubiquinone/menaquinone biosynthesis C-methylase UbiE